MEPPPPPQQPSSHMPAPPPPKMNSSPGGGGYPGGTCLFCSRPWHEPEHHHFIVEDRKRKLESLSKDDTFSATMFRYILGNHQGSPSVQGEHKEILDRFVRVSSHHRSRGESQLPLCNLCLGLVYELKELHVTLERIQNLIIDKVKEIKGQFAVAQGQHDVGGGESEEQSPQEEGWDEAHPEQQHQYLFPFPHPGELVGGAPNFALQNLFMKDERHGGGEMDIASSLKMDSEARRQVEEGLGGDMNIPSSSQSDCGSSIADGSIDSLNFDGTRRGRRRKPVQLVDNAKKSKNELIAHMKSVNKDLYICDIDGCYAFFNTVQGLSQHKRQHFRDSWPVCGVCNYTTPWPSAMNRHFSTQHPGVEKNIKRASRRNPSCAFTVNAFIQQNENPESPSQSSGGGGDRKHNRNYSNPPPRPSAPSSTVASPSPASTPTSSTSASPSSGVNNGHPIPNHPQPITMANSPNLLQWKQQQANAHHQAVATATAVAAAAAAFSNPHNQRRFCPTGFNFEGPR